MESLDDLASDISDVSELLSDTVKNGHKILICGNGESASDAQHFAAELVGRFQKERHALPALSLSTDTSVLTALANDYGYSTIFSRQVESFGRKNDVLIGISTSGNSENIRSAVKKAKEMGMRTVGLLGRNGGSLKNEVEIDVTVSHSSTARIQEAHIFILHFWAGQIENNLFPS